MVLAHGAGGHKDHPHVLAIASLLEALGTPVERFNFPYSDRGTRRIDPMPVLLESARAAAEAARARHRPRRLILAGHSMGGRVFSMAAAEGFPADGLLLFSYPWHPPGKPGQPRSAHLPAIPVPVLCFTGTRDPFCERDRLAGVFRTLPKGWTQHWVEGADHGLEVLKRSGRAREDVLAEVSGAVSAWLAKAGGAG